MVGHPVYFLYGSGPPIAVSGPLEEFFNGTFGIWMGVKHFSGGYCRPIKMHKVWRALGISNHIVKHLSILRHEVSMIWSIVVPEKWHVSPHSSDKVGGNKGGSYTIRYASGSDSNKISVR